MRRKEYFEFKQFTVHQSNAAMKVGTDGALLGSLAEGGKRILDIGTGTGLLSLMMAQRCPEAEITAIDIDENAIIDAKRNFAESPFAEQIQLIHTPFNDFVDNNLKANADFKPFDCIICNPPYFDESLESKDESRTRARHTSSLPFRELVGGAYELLADEGVFSVCIPPEVLSKFTAECIIKGFCLKYSYAVKSVPRKLEPKRYVLVYKKGKIVEPQEFTYCLQNADGSRSDWYSDLMKDFYL